MNMSVERAVLPPSNNDWPPDTPEYTFTLRALYELGKQMRGEEWPQDVGAISTHILLPELAEALRKRCASGEMNAALQSATGDMYPLKRAVADRLEFSDALACGAAPLNIDWIDAEDYRNLVGQSGTVCWIFLESRTLAPAPEAFDGMDIHQDPLAMPFWSLGIAISWILNPTSEGIRTVCMRGVEQLQLTPGFEAARVELVSALSRGMLKAVALHNGEVTEIPATEWMHLKWHTDEKGGDGHRFYLWRASVEIGGTYYRDIRLHRQDVVHRWTLDVAPITGGVASSTQLGVETVLITSSETGCSDESESAEATSATLPGTLTAMKLSLRLAREFMRTNGLPDLNRTEVEEELLRHLHRGGQTLRREVSQQVPAGRRRTSSMLRNRINDLEDCRRFIEQRHYEISQR
jgi:hypothetical protein